MLPTQISIIWLWDCSMLRSSCCIIYVSHTWIITLLTQIHLMEATFCSINIVNACWVSHTVRISSCTSHQRRGTLFCTEITLSLARISTCHYVHSSECKPCPDTNWKWKMLTKISAMWVMIYDWFCPGTSTMFVNKALRFMAANNSLERQFQLD